MIIRTEAEDCSEEELAADLTYLTRLWDRIRRDAEAAAAPALIHADLDVVLKAVRDLFTSDTDRLLIDSKEDYKRVEEFVKTFQPHLRLAARALRAARSRSSTRCRSSRSCARCSSARSGSSRAAT